MAAEPIWALTPAAKADLADIWQHGAVTWGMAQADQYADGLFALFDLLAAFPELSRERTELSPPVRIHPSGAHLVIYRIAGQGVEVIRLLHARQDLRLFLQDG
jgi:toxin ParE1/3/4